MKNKGWNELEWEKQQLKKEGNTFVFAVIIGIAIGLIACMVILLNFK